MGGVIYSLCGLTVSLPFPCPLLEPIDAASADIEVREADVPRTLGPGGFGVDNWEAGPGRFLLRGGAKCGRFLVEGGNVTFRRNPAAEDDIVAFHFLHSVVAAVFRQRGYLVMHANSAVGADGKAVVISGESGAGKSTTLAGLIARGYKMLADDVTVLRASEHDRVEVLPGTPQFHLTDEAADRLGHDVSEAPRFPWRAQKAAVPSHQSMAAMPAELGTIYLLAKGDVESPVFTPLGGVDKFHALQRCLYGPLFPDEHPEAFPAFGLVVRQARVVRVIRPHLGWTLPEVLTNIHAERMGPAS